MSLPKTNIEPFEKDAAARGGYVYTSTERLSCRLATGRSLDVVLEAGQLADRSILDMGCGDGYYTIRYWDRGGPAR